MSNTIPRKEFAEQCGIANNAMPVYVARGKIVMIGTRCSKCDGKKKPCKECSEREYIDLNYRNPEGKYLNLDFYKKFAQKEPEPKQEKVVKEKMVVHPTFIKPVTLIKTPPPEDEPDLSDLSENSTDGNLDKAIKYSSIKDKQAATRIKELQEAKMRGELIPVNLVQETIQSFAEAVKKSYSDAGEHLIMLISERLGAQEHDKAFMRTKLLDTTNKAIDDSVNMAQEKLKPVSTSDE